MSAILKLLGCEGFDETALQRHAIAAMNGRQMMRSHPILGGAFGQGAFHLATAVLTPSAHGPQRLFVFVIHDATSFPLAVGDTRSEVLGKARSIIQRAPAHDLALFLGQIAQIQAAEKVRRMREQVAKDAEQRRQRLAEHNLVVVSGERDGPVQRTPPVPRRRRAIFDKSEGKCHYCGCKLQLEGRWHIEHMVPRALGGRSEESNLVAACAPCNLKKRDQTDHEFMARKEGACA